MAWDGGCPGPRSATRTDDNDFPGRLIIKLRCRRVVPRHLARPTGHSLFASVIRNKVCPRNKCRDGPLTTLDAVRGGRPHMRERKTTWPSTTPFRRLTERGVPVRTEDPFSWQPFRRPRPPCLREPRGREPGTLQWPRTRIGALTSRSR